MNRRKYNSILKPGFWWNFIKNNNWAIWIAYGNVQPKWVDYWLHDQDYSQEKEQNKAK